MQVEFQVAGLAELEAKILAMGEQLGRKHLDLALQRGANVLADEARQRAPIRNDGKPKQLKAGADRGDRLPGFLLQDIDRRRGRTKSRWSFLWKIGTTARAFYARFLEFGTAHQPAQPWLRPSLDTSSEEAIRAVRDYMVEVVR